MALRMGTEERINMRYIIRCLGVWVNFPWHLFGDNLGVIQNALNPEADIKKKHVLSLGEGSYCYWKMG